MIRATVNRNVRLGVELAEYSKVLQLPVEGNAASGTGNAIGSGRVGETGHCVGRIELALSNNALAE
jgi:hypothetical protein